MARKKAPAFVASAMSPDDKAIFFTALSDWYKEKRALDVHKDTEAALRKQIAEKYFGKQPEGMNTVPLDFGKVLKCGIVVSRPVESKQLAGLHNVATGWAATLDNHELKAKGELILSIIDRLFVYKPDLVVSEWKALSQDERNLFADVVTEKPGMPSLAIADASE